MRQLWIGEGARRISGLILGTFTGKGDRGLCKTDKAPVVDVSEYY